MDFEEQSITPKSKFLLGENTRHFFLCETSLYLDFFPFLSF